MPNMMPKRKTMQNGGGSRICRLGDWGGGWPLLKQKTVLVYGAAGAEFEQGALAPSAWLPIPLWRRL